MQELDTIESICKRALALDAESEQARQDNDEERGTKIYEELISALAPKAEQIANTTKDNKAFAHFAHGIVLRVLRLYEDALASFQLSLVERPNIENTLLEITMCLGQLNRHEEAELYARRCVVISPQSGSAWGNLAMVLIQLNQKAEAFDSISKAVTLDPYDSKFRYIADHFNQYFR